MTSAAYNIQKLLSGDQFANFLAGLAADKLDIASIPTVLEFLEIDPPGQQRHEVISVSKMTEMFRTWAQNNRRQDKISETQIGLAFKRFGLVRDRVRINGEREYIYNIDWMETSKLILHSLGLNVWEIYHIRG